MKIKIQFSRAYALVKAHDFDPTLGGNHQQVTVTLAGHKFDVDVKLKDMLERLNSTSLGLITSMSCQYDFGGYSSIDIIPTALVELLALMRNKHIEKYGSASTYAEKSLYSAIMHGNGFKYYEMIGHKNIDDNSTYFFASTSICVFKTQLFETDNWDDEKKEMGTILYYHTLMHIHPKLVDYFVLLWDELMV